MKKNVLTGLILMMAVGALSALTWNEKVASLEGEFIEVRYGLDDSDIKPRVIGTLQEIGDDYVVVRMESRNRRGKVIRLTDVLIQKSQIISIISAVKEDQLTSK